jgi:uracil-DNA glycosylase
MGSAADFMPERTTLPALREAAAGCRGCDLFKDATQTVFSEGRTDARIVMVGEQPGDREDVAGRPFVGPAGRAPGPRDQGGEPCA